MNQVTTEFFPTATQRKTLAATDSELIAIIRRQADKDGFVALDFTSWARMLHAWPEVSTGHEAREQFVRERIDVFIRLGLLHRAEKVLDGCRVRGFVTKQRKNSSLQDGSTTPQLTPKDCRFLRRLKIVW